MIKDVFADSKTPSKLFQIEVSPKTNHLRAQDIDIDIGIGTKSYISRSKASDSEKAQFLNECKDFFHRNDQQNNYKV